MHDLLLKPTPDSATPIRLEPGAGALHHIGFAVHRLNAGDILALEPETGCELCLVVLSGQGALSLDGDDPQPFGDRATPFAGKAHAAYLPPGHRWRIEARADMEIAICKTPAHEGGLDCLRIGPRMQTTQTRGTGTNTRYVTNILAEGDGRAERLFVIELRTPGGHTSSYPPHKHDTDALPGESPLEETYYSRFNPRQGFAFQRIYTDDRSLDVALVLEDGTLSLVPRGYHPCAVCHGYDLYQLCVMAGPRRIWRFTNDPAHDWLLQND